MTFHIQARQTTGGTMLPAVIKWVVITISAVTALAILFELWRWLRRKREP
jgi:hypothetical protein